MNNLSHVRIIGIDCAADPKNIAAASARQVGAQLIVDRLFFGKNGPADTRTERINHLATYITEQMTNERPTILALDAPLGWPVAMRKALADGTAGSVAGIPECAREDARLMFRRATDLFVANKTGKTPQSVGASWVASLTHTALRLLHMIAEKCQERSISMSTAPLDRRDSLRKDVQIIEVYPALAGPLFLRGPSCFESWTAVGDELNAFRKERWDTIAERLRRRLQTDCADWSLDVKTDQRLRDHGLDAILCAWTAWRFLQGECVSPPTAERDIRDEHLAREGWIWFDRGTPVLLGKARSKKRANAR